MDEWLCNTYKHAHHLSLLDGDDHLLHLALVQYVFKEVEQEVIAAPHGSSKHDDKYTRTMSSIMAKLKKVAGKSTPKNAVKIVFQEGWWSVKCSKCRSTPTWQTTGQGHPTCFKFRCWSPVLCDDVQKKGGKGRKNENAFVRQVNVAPYPMMCLTVDWTLHDLACFCTNPKNFSILGVDATFDLGDFDVTVTTYRYLMLELKGSSPKASSSYRTFVHVCKNFKAYHFFASTLVSKCPELRQMEKKRFQKHSQLCSLVQSIFAVSFISGVILSQSFAACTSQMSSWKNLFLAIQQF